MLTTVFEALDTFERRPAERGITVPQALAAAIAHGLAEHGLLPSPPTASTERHRD